MAKDPNFNFDKKRIGSLLPSYYNKPQTNREESLSFGKIKEVLWPKEKTGQLRSADKALPLI